MPAQGPSGSPTNDSDSAPADDERDSIPAIARADELPPKAAIAATPARPAAFRAAGPSPSTLIARAPPRSDAEPIFVPDFLGQTITHAQRIAASEAIELSTRGAIEGRVVSQIPVAGTVLNGADRTVRLHFATEREEG